MTGSPLIIRSKAFALDVIKVCKDLRVAKCERALINQFLRSGTSIDANHKYDENYINVMSEARFKEL